MEPHSSGISPIFNTLAALVITLRFYLSAGGETGTVFLASLLKCSVVYIFALAALGVSKLVWSARNRKYKSNCPNFYEEQEFKRSDVSWRMFCTVCVAFALLKLLVLARLDVPDVIVLFTCVLNLWDSQRAYRELSVQLARGRIVSVLDTLHASLSHFPYSDIKSYVFSCLEKHSAHGWNTNRLEYECSGGRVYTAPPGEPVLFVFVALGRYAVDYERNDLRDFVDEHINEVFHNQNSFIC